MRLEDFVEELNLVLKNHGMQVLMPGVRNEDRFKVTFEINLVKERARPRFGAFIRYRDTLEDYLKKMGLEDCFIASQAKLRCPPSGKCWQISCPFFTPELWKRLPIAKSLKIPLAG